MAPLEMGIHLPANSDMGVVWGLLCLHPNTIKPRYYYHSSSSSSRRELVRPNSQRFPSLPINSSLQNDPKYQFSLKSENIEILPILSAAIRSRFFLGQNILPTMLNRYA
jgi:hypothetical protein